MHLGDTIVACASPPGRAGRALVRLSGPGVFPLLHSVMKGAVPCERGARPALLSAEKLTLPVLLACFPAPHSYTGEDAAEIQCPGNPTLVDRLLRAITVKEGVRLAEPGEFTARAYLARRLSLEQAEGVAATIAAANQDQLDAARDLLEGRTGKAYRAWSEELATLLALVEAGIDFTDQEDVVAISADALRMRLQVLKAEIEQHAGVRAGAEAQNALPRVALVGAPNAGKSTLFNAMLGRQRAVMSPVAGTTRDVLVEEIDLSAESPGAGSVLLEDLAGLERGRSPESSIASAAAQTAARQAVADADLLVWCDPAGLFEAFDNPLPAKPMLRVRTFGDQPVSQPTREDLAVCSVDGWNLGLLRRAIAERAVGGRAAGISALLPRHRRAMTGARHRLEDALTCIGGGSRLTSPEVVALTLRHGLDELGELVGHISPDEVLGRVFAAFCVGK